MKGSQPFYKNKNKGTNKTNNRLVITLNIYSTWNAIRRFADKLKASACKTEAYEVLWSSWTCSISRSLVPLVFGKFAPFPRRALAKHPQPSSVFTDQSDDLLTLLSSVYSTGWLVLLMFFCRVVEWRQFLLI